MVVRQAQVNFHLLDLVFLENPLLLLVRPGSESYLDGDLVALGGVDHALHEAALLQRHPARPLRVVGLK